MKKLSVNITEPILSPPQLFLLIYRGDSALEASSLEFSSLLFVLQIDVHTLENKLKKHSGVFRFGQSFFSREKK